MTDQELIVAAAEKVCGWALRTTANGVVLADIDDGSYRLTERGYARRWNPLESIADAWMLVEAIRERIPIQKQTQTYTCQVCQTGIPGEWTAEFCVNHGDWSTQARATAPTAPRVITLAALKAVGVEI